MATKKKPTKKRASKKPFWTILYLPTACYIRTSTDTSYSWASKFANTSLLKGSLTDVDFGHKQKSELASFKTEDAAYEFLFRSVFKSRSSKMTSLIVMLLISELSKDNPYIAYEMFLNDNKECKPVNHITVSGYLKKHNLWKSGFKAYCNMVAIMGLASGLPKFCFEHFDVSEQPAGTNITTLGV
ncbi:MAG: hypothetical protein JHC33_03030 [Ignisphaera sp.]|nr:hypothetical protein [Ignisphaera sp.]